MTSLSSLQKILTLETEKSDIDLGINHEGKILAYKSNSNGSGQVFFPIVGLEKIKGNSKKQIQESLKAYSYIFEHGVLISSSSSNSKRIFSMQKWLAENGPKPTLAFGSLRITSTDLKTILVWTKTFHNYTHLNFNTRQLFKAGTEEVTILAEIIQINSRLTSLDLFGNWLGDQGVSKLISTITKHPALTQLKIGGNRIGDEGLNFLLPLFGKKSKIQYLDLSTNLIGDGVLEVLIGILKKNTSLKQLNLKNNPISEEGKTKLKKAFENTPLSLILSSNTGIPSTPKRIKKGESSSPTFEENLAASTSSPKGKHVVEERTQIPPSYTCPISHQLMRNPVVAADGETYEREMITRAILSNGLKSPVHGVELEDDRLVANKQLEREIRSFLDKNPALKDEIFIPEGLKGDCIQAIKEGDIRKLKLVLNQDERLFTQNITDDLTLIDLACQASFKILQTVVNAFPTDAQPKLIHPLCVKVSESIGSHGLKLLIDCLPGRQIPLEIRLVTAIKMGSIPYMQAVLDLGADPNMPLKDGRTPFHEAAEFGDQRVIDLIMERKGNPKIKDENGLTPAQVAGESKKKYIEQKRLLLKMGPIVDPLFQKIEEQSKTIRILIENQIGIYQSLKEVTGAFSTKSPDYQRIRMAAATLQDQLRQSLIEGELKQATEILESTTSAITQMEEDEENLEKTESIRTNNLIYLLNETFLLLENVLSAQKKRHYHKESNRELISHYASVSLLMRTFHMLGALSNHKKLKEYGVPELLADSYKIGKIPNAYNYRNQMMHYAYKFEGKTPLLIETINQLSPIFDAIRTLRMKGTLDVSSFQPPSSNTFSIYRLVGSEDSDKIVKNQTLALRHLKLFMGEMQRLFLEAHWIKNQGTQMWEHDGVLHAAISGLCCAIGQRLRDLKEHHKPCYNHIIQSWEKLNPDLIKKRTICGYECEGTFFEIDRTMWGHVFKDDDERPGMANGKIIQQAAFELLSPNELWNRLEFAEKTKSMLWEDF